MNSNLSSRDALLALAVMAVWGTNFAFIHIGLETLPPLLFAALRFTFVVLPAIFFLPRPNVSWANLAGYGLAIGMGQFGLLFYAMDGLISPGLASLVIQCQVFFTIGFALWRGAVRGTGERINGHQIGAIALAAAGIAIIIDHTGHDTTILGLVLILGAGASWALANQIAREVGKVNMLAYVVWSSLFAIPPLYLLSLWHEGLSAIAHGLAAATPVTWAVVLWQSAANTMFGYGCWAWLLARYPAATVSPMALLVPVFGFAGSALLVGEKLDGWKILATLLVMAGLAINLLWRPRQPV